MHVYVFLYLFLLCKFFSAIVYDENQKSSIFNGSRVKHYEFGYLPVKNKTKTNPQVLCAFLSTGSEGYSMIEFGIVDENVIKLDMNKYLARSFGLGFAGGNYQIYDVSKIIEQVSNIFMKYILVTKRVSHFVQKVGTKSHSDNKLGKSRFYCLLCQNVSLNRLFVNELVK